MTPACLNGGSRPDLSWSSDSCGGSALELSGRPRRQAVRKINLVGTAWGRDHRRCDDELGAERVTGIDRRYDRGEMAAAGSSDIVIEQKLVRMWAQADFIDLARSLVVNIGLHHIGSKHLPFE